MDPFSLLGLVGAGLSFGGTLGSLFESKEAKKERERQAQLELQLNQKRREAMELSARRMQTENLRNTQLQRSMALTSATAQGAQLGTGLAGGLAQVSATGAWNAAGISQNLEIGRDMFGLNEQISRSKMSESDSMSQMAMYQGLSSLGGSMFSASGKLGSLFGGQTYGRSPTQMNWGPTYGDAINMMGKGPIY